MAHEFRGRTRVNEPHHEQSREEHQPQKKQVQLLVQTNQQTQRPQLNAVQPSEQ